MKKDNLIKQVKKLRQELGLSMMDIREALVEADGDEKKAKEILKKKGFAKADKKAVRDTKEGRVFVYKHATEKMAVLVELLCETDFVAKSDDYQALGKNIAIHIAAMNPKNKKELLEQEFVKDPSTTIDSMVKTMVAKLGENIKVGKFVRYEI